MIQKNSCMKIKKIAKKLNYIVKSLIGFREKESM